jgi:hypothetical protein
VTEQPPAPAAKPQRRISKVWVLVVLISGILLGVLLAHFIATAPIRLGPGRFFLLSAERALQLHVILSTMETVLLFSLVLVYIKIYAETKANFSMGILIVLFALLIHSVLSLPFAVNQIGPILLGSGAFFPYPDLLTIVAYTIFLYLSLE